MKIFFNLRPTCWALLLPAYLHGACAPLGGQVNSTSLQASSAAVSGVSGRTVNAVTGAPLSRVLICYGQQAVLTDYQGQFHFHEDLPGSSLVATKPGYYLSQYPGDGIGLPQTTPSARPIQIMLFPEGILVGSVVSGGGDPLGGVIVSASRSHYDESGHHWIQAGTSRTDIHGEFRLPLMAGMYRLRTMYLAPNNERLEAILPSILPEATSSDRLGVIRLNAGETQHIELNPQRAAVASLTVRLEPETGRGNVRLTASATDEAVFPLRHTGTGIPSEMKIEIPHGTYMLNATRQSEEGLEQGQARVLIGKANSERTLLRMSPVNQIPVEITREASETSDNKLPSASQLGLSLENTQDELDPDDASLRVIQRSTQAAYFNPPPGSYRLHAQSGGEWYIVAATYGASDLLRQSITVSPGVGSAPLRLVVGNQPASLSGTVRLPSQANSAWVYLLASTPSATPVVIVRAAVDGRYTRAALSPGTYRVLAFEHRHEINFQNPQILSTLGAAAVTITLRPGDKGTLDLDLMPFVEAVE